MNPAGLSAGPYSGSIAVTAAGANSLSIPVSVTIQPALEVVAGSGNGAIFLMPTATPGIFAADTTIVTNTAGSAFTASVSGQGLIISPTSGTLPTVLHTSVDASKFAPGTYQGTITLNIPDANPASRTLAVSYTVNAPQPAQVMTQAPGLTFSLTAAAPKPPAKQWSGNLGRAQSTLRPAPISPGFRSRRHGRDNFIGRRRRSRIDLDLSGFAPGTYHGAVTVSSASNSVTIPVNVSVSALTTGIALSQTGLTFNAVAGASVSAAAVVHGSQYGSCSLRFEVSTSTTSGGSNWLSRNARNGQHGHGARRCRSQ